MSAFACLSHVRRGSARAAVLLFAGLAGLALAGCGPTGDAGFGGPDNTLAAPTTPVQVQPLNGSAAVGETLGAGPVRVGVILPLTQGSAPSPVGVSLRNAAQIVGLPLLDHIIVTDTEHFSFRSEEGWE